ncbi:MAG: flagellar biosynthetic protein FliO [Oscillospiraceae bacterium]
MNETVNSSGDILWLLTSMMGIVLVLALAYFGSRWVGKRMSSIVSGSKIRIIDKAMLGQDKYLAVVRVGEKVFLVGISGQSINMLSELDSEDFKELPIQQEQQPDFKEILENAKIFIKKVRSGDNDSNNQKSDGK